MAGSSQPSEARRGQSQDPGQVTGAANNNQTNSRDEERSDKLHLHLPSDFHVTFLVSQIPGSRLLLVATPSNDDNDDDQCPLSRPRYHPLPLLQHAHVPYSSSPIATLAPARHGRLAVVARTKTLIIPMMKMRASSTTRAHLISRWTWDYPQNGS
jgi:hypothetical protein